ncbi:MAG: hypothetical protein ACSHWZ_10360 [Sulfitobacter sp.]
MFRMIRFMIPFGLGIVMGWKFHDKSGQARCAAMGGEWAENICLKSE